MQNCIHNSISPAPWKLWNHAIAIANHSLRAADGGEFPMINVFSLLKGAKVSGSSTGAPWEIKEMLQLAADKNLKPWIQERPMKDANQAIVDMEEGKARYRYVLVNEDIAGTVQNKL